MSAANPVLRNTAYCLAHVPEWVRFGSKPRRELRRDPTLAASLKGALRDFARCVAYPPNQVFVGRLTPAELGRLPRPWFETAPAGAGEVEALRCGPFGEIVDDLADQMSAATPAALGADMLVPEDNPYKSLGVEERILLPGAAMSMPSP